MTPHKNRLEDQPAFVLHSYPFRETSLLLEVFSRNYGRLAMVARGARRPRSAMRGLLMNFQPLRMAWFGKGEVRTLHGAETALCKKLAQACETTAANTVAAAPDVELIHPGVMKYFREIGLAK